MKKVLVPLAEGFEELEAVTCIDVLRRANITVITASRISTSVTGVHGITIVADKLLADIVIDDLDGIVLPGGMPGATNLRDDQEIIEITQQLHNQGKLVAAICAAPIVLEKAGILHGKSATSYPGFSNLMESCNYLEENVITDGNIITSRGPGLAIEFALTVVTFLTDQDTSEKVGKGMLVS